MEKFLQQLQHFLSFELFGTSIAVYFSALGWMALGIFCVWLVNWSVLNRFKRWAQGTATTWDDFLIEIIQRRVVPYLYFLVVALVIKSLPWGAVVEQMVDRVLVVMLTLTLILMATGLIKKIIDDKEIKAIHENQKTAFKGLYPALNTLIWVIGIVFLLDNFGLDISAVVTGLGIGGVAVALAAQAILGDLFSYFAILLDRPFELGDFIIIGDIMGTVEHIGLKTTRIRSLSGEQVIFANHDLTSSRVRNYKRMFQRRVVFRLGIVYETPLEKVEKVPGLIRNAIEQQADVRFDRSHFFQFGAHSLDFEAVYFVLDGDYNHYMDIQQSVNFAIMKLFREEGVVFAYPTQVIYTIPSPSEKV